MILEDLFKFHHAKSKGFEEYENGDIAFVTNGLANNGIIGYVNPKNSDRVFHFNGICISAFCEATVQRDNFLPRGNGGSGLLVLEPKNKMSFDELVQVASCINVSHMWKFSYGRMVNAERAKKLEIWLDKDMRPKNKISDMIKDKRTEIKHTRMVTKFKAVNITEFFELERGQFHAIDRLAKGKYPTISRVAYDNGIVGFFEKPRNAEVYPKGMITIATTTGDAFVQLDNFIATDNVVILIPKQKMSLGCLLFIASMINREKWRVSYGRQCYKTVFAKTNIFLPIKENGDLDNECMNEISSNSYNFKGIEAYITSS